MSNNVPARVTFLVAGLLLVTAAVAPMAAADIGPKPTVDVAVRLNGAPVPDQTFYAQMLTCDTGKTLPSDRCGFDDPSCDRFEALAVPEQGEGCTWLLQGPPTVWGGACQAGECHFSYFLPGRFRLAVYLPGMDRLFVSNPVTRTVLNSSYRLDLAEDGSARLVETTSLLRRSHAGSVLIALFLSLLIELAAGFVFVRLTHSPARALLGVLIGNVLTVPLLWFVMSSTFGRDAFLLALVLCEVGAVLVEAAIIWALARGGMRPTKAFAMSLLLNAISFVLGVPALTFLAFVGIVQ